MKRILLLSIIFSIIFLVSAEAESYKKIDATCLEDPFFDKCVDDFLGDSCQYNCTSGGDSLGNHTASEDLDMNSFDINNVDHIDLDGNLSLSELISCDNLKTDENGILYCDDDLATDAYLSLTVLGDSNLKVDNNVFDEDEYTLYSYENNTDWEEFFYFPDTGVIQPNTTGLYEITWITHARASSYDEYNFMIKENDINIWGPHQYFIHTSVDPVDRTISIIRNVERGKNLTFHINNTDGVDTVAAHDGTTINIKKVVGPANGSWTCEGGDSTPQEHWVEFRDYSTLYDCVGGIGFDVCMVGRNLLETNGTWVAHFNGSITGMNFNLPTPPGDYTTYPAWVVYVNGVQTDMYINSSNYSYYDYKTQASGLDTFSEGDKIRVSVNNWDSTGATSTASHLTLQVFVEKDV